MLANIFGGVFGKWIAGGAAALGVAAVIYIGFLMLQIKDKENLLLTQANTISTQAETIATRDLTISLNKAANDVLTERMTTKATDDALTITAIEDILKQGINNDGPVAPVLADVVRANPASVGK